MSKQVLMLVALISGCVFAESPAPTAAQRLACYEAGYRMIFVDVLKLTQDRTGHRGQSQESYEEALSEATFVAAQENGLVTESHLGYNVEVSVAKLDSPLSLIGLEEGQAISDVGVQTRFRTSIPRHLGAPVPRIYAYALNTAIKNGLSYQIMAIPACAGVFKLPAPTRLAIGKIF